MQYGKGASRRVEEEFREWVNTRQLSEKKMALKAGRELDALVAEKVMGLPGAAVGGWYNPNLLDGPPPYSTDIAAAWEVVEKLLELGWHVDIEDGWCVIVYGGRDGKADSEMEVGETAPEAICLAALEAVKASE